MSAHAIQEHVVAAKDDTVHGDVVNDNQKATSESDWQVVVTEEIQLNQKSPAAPHEDGETIVDDETTSDERQLYTDAVQSTQLKSDPDESVEQADAAEWGSADNMIEAQLSLDPANAAIASTSNEDESSENYQELYVCGQCSIGFPSLAECQTHLADEHNMTEPAEVEEGHVSIGTQANMHKRVGRKTREEMALAMKERDPEKPQDLKCTDLSFATHRMRDGAEGKRPVRPPKKLLQDYQLGRRKAKPPPRPCARLLCPRKKCKAKFRSKEGLDCHKKCHTEKGNYKCAECDFHSTNWKPMQWHMWLEHKLDIDLCKCHLCNFR
jgi:hypothetical protein